MKKLPFSKLAALALLLPLATACGLRGDEFLQALPTTDDVKLNVPGQDGQALALGETSEFYEMTWNISRGVNGHVGAVFLLIERIVSMPPSVSEENMRQWGPSEPQGLERNSFKFTAYKVAEGEFTYALEARAKDSEDDADWKVVFDGVAHPAEDNVGNGQLVLHFDTMNELNDDCTVGTATIDYDANAADGARRAIDIDFDQVANVCNDEDRTIATYHYSEDKEDGSGDFEFSFNGDIHAGNADEDKPLLETFTIKSRWLSEGAGRSDVRLSGGEIPGDLETHLPNSGRSDVEVTECWDDNFGLVYSDTLPEELREIAREQLGDAGDCAFADQDLPDAPAAS
jgi:hypothetical protein